MTFFTYYNKTSEAIYYFHKVIYCNKEVIASMCLLQYVKFIATRSLCCVNLFASKFITTVCNNFYLHCNNILLQQLCSYYNDFVVIATIFPIVLYTLQDNINIILRNYNNKLKIQIKKCKSKSTPSNFFV